jgi:hypothetical protein
MGFHHVGRNKEKARHSGEGGPGMPLGAREERDGGKD